MRIDESENPMVRATRFMTDKVSNLVSKFIFRFSEILPFLTENLHLAWKTHVINGAVGLTLRKEKIRAKTFPWKRKNCV